MAKLETPQLPEPKAMPQYMVGAASPLWAYFGTAALGGVAFWWMTRWARPTNLEALFAKVDAIAAPMIEPVLEAVEAAAEIWRSGEPGTRVLHHDDGDVEVFLEPHRAPPRVIAISATDVARAVCRRRSPSPLLFFGASPSSPSSGSSATSNS